MCQTLCPIPSKFIYTFQQLLADMIFSCLYNLYDKVRLFCVLACRKGRSKVPFSVWHNEISLLSKSNQNIRRYPYTQYNTVVETIEKCTPKKKSQEDDIQYPQNSTPKETPTFTEYTECQAFCPVVGPPNPSPTSERCSHPLGPGGVHSLAGEGLGNPISFDEGTDTLVLCVDDNPSTVSMQIFHLFSVCGA